MRIVWHMRSYSVIAMMLYGYGSMDNKHNTHEMFYYQP